MDVISSFNLVQLFESKSCTKIGRKTHLCEKIPLSPIGRSATQRMNDWPKGDGSGDTYSLQALLKIKSNSRKIKNVQKKCVSENQ